MLAKTNYKMIKCIFFMTKLYYIKLKENDIPDFFSVTFISFLIYCILFSFMAIYVEITNNDFPSKTYFLGSMILILLGTSLIIFKLKKWHKLDAATELAKISNKTKYTSYLFIALCFISFAFFTFWW